jgi:hypothetical protein
MPVQPKRPFFSIDITINETYSIEEIWPDGDAPENPTVDDVVKVIQACGGPDRVAQDWNLLDGLSLDISGPGGCRTLVGPGTGRVIGAPVFIKPT